MALRELYLQRMSHKDTKDAENYDIKKYNYLCDLSASVAKYYQC